MRATLLSPTGPQHPTFHWDFSGQRDPTLTWLGGSTRLTLRPATEGTYTLFDRNERDVLLELSLRADEERRVALAPGAYVVNKRNSKELLSTRVALARGDDKLLYDRDMQAVPWARLAQKGGLGKRWLTIAAGQTWTALETQAHPTLRFGPEWEGAHWSLGFETTLSSGTDVHNGLPSRLTTGGLQGLALHNWSISSLSLQLGPTAGVLFMGQSAPGHGTQTSFGAMFGGRTRILIRMSNAIHLVAEQDVSGILTKVHDSPELARTPFGRSLGNDLGIIGTASYGMGIQAGW